MQAAAVMEADNARADAEPVDEALVDDSLRRCIATGTVLPREQMIRFVVAPDPQLGLVPDVAGTLPGRGIWVTAQRHAVEMAIARKAFARAARAPVLIEPGLADRVEAALLRRLIDWLGLARRAGAAIAGFEKTNIAYTRGTLVLVVEAVDASRGGSERMAGPEIPRATILTRDELAYVFARDTLVHVGIVDASWAKRIAAEAARLAGFRRPFSPT